MNQSNMKVTLLIPTLNEISGMKEIMPRIKKEWYDQLIVVDEGSTDGTKEYARENGYFLLNQKKAGMINGYFEALEHATGDIVITFSPDGNSIPELIPALVEKMKQGYDMVIVSRYTKGAKSYDDDIVTAFGNWMFTNLINFLFGARYTDTLVIFRAWKRELMHTLEVDKYSNSFIEEALLPKSRKGTVLGPEPLLSVRCAKKKLKVAEIPGDEPPRIGGKRKLRPICFGAIHLIQVLREAFNRS